MCHLHGLIYVVKNFSIQSRGVALIGFFGLMITIKHSLTVSAVVMLEQVCIADGLMLTDLGHFHIHDV